jgi:hypothetical protein
LCRLPRAFGLSVVALLAACSGKAATDQQHAAAEAACRAQGLVPHTAAFAACLNPTAAPVLQQGAATWDQLTDSAQ